MPERVPPLEASIHIDAPPARVWQIVADQRRMNEFSPEVYRQKFFGDEIGRGTVSINLNKRKGFFWPSASRITAEAGVWVAASPSGPRARTQAQATPP